jgi:broad specificity phosphatase PhoE
MAKVLANRYFLLRHGRSEANAQGLIIADPRIGATGFGLTAEGRAQVGASIAACGDLDRTTLILCSQFLRARQSAELAQELLGCAAPIVDVRLRERGFGIFEGGSDSNYPTVWSHDAPGTTHAVQDVEPVDVVRERVVALVDELERTHHGRHILLVGHGDPLQILWTWFANLPASAHRRLGPIAPGQLIAL